MSKQLQGKWLMPWGGLEVHHSIVTGQGLTKRELKKIRRIMLQPMLSIVRTRRRKQKNAIFVEIVVIFVTLVLTRQATKEIKSATTARNMDM